jgi:Matrixin
MKPIRNIFVLALILITSFSAVFGNTIIAGAGRAEVQRLRWKGQVVRIAFSNSLMRPNSNIKSDSDVAGALKRSVQAWTDVADIDIQLEASDKQSVSPAGPAGDGVSLITIAQSPENVLFFVNDAESVSAKTRIFYNRRGFITEADIALNPFQQFSTDGTYGTFDLESTLTHEIGHLLGLRHSAVLGSTMADSFARNGTRGIIDFSPRTLAESDVTSTRDLYGVKTETIVCCSSIGGRLSAAGRTLTALKIWAEDSQSGRVVAQTESLPDGTYRLGGLDAGNYDVYWKGQEMSAQNAFGTIGSVHVSAVEDVNLNGRVNAHASEFSLQYLGINGRLADFSLPLVSGRSYTLNVGGKDLSGRTANIEFNTSHITALSLPPVTQEFGEGVQGLTFFISVDREILPGQYTVVLADETGAKTCMIGGLTVE